VGPSHSQISSLSTTILALGKARSRREPNLGYRKLTDLGDATFCTKKSLHESCRMGRRIVVMKMICSLGHGECDGYTVHKLSQRRLTADWLSPRESECSRMHSKVFSDWMPSYIKAKRPVLEIFRMAEYFTDSLRKKKELRRMKLYNVRLQNLYFQRNIIRVDRLKSCATWYAVNESLV
jgi:hypothetical protein